jgi:hypothetical protein
VKRQGNIGHPRASKKQERAAASNKRRKSFQFKRDQRKRPQTTSQSFDVKCMTVKAFDAKKLHFLYIFVYQSFFLS